MSCYHGVRLEHFVPFDDVFAPAFVPVVAFRVSFGIARERTNEFLDTFEFVIESVCRSLVVFILEGPEKNRGDGAVFDLLGSSVS